MKRSIKAYETVESTENYDIYNIRGYNVKVSRIDDPTSQYSYQWEVLDESGKTLKSGKSNNISNSRKGASKAITKLGRSSSEETQLTPSSNETKESDPSDKYTRYLNRQRFTKADAMKLIKSWVDELNDPEVKITNNDPDVWDHGTRCMTDRWHIAHYLKLGPIYFDFWECGGTQRKYGWSVFKNPSSEKTEEIGYLNTTLHDALLKGYEEAQKWIKKNPKYKGRTSSKKK